MRVPPLARFIALGGLLFAIDRASTPEPSIGADHAIELSPATQRLLLDETRDRLGRQPTAAEIDQALRSWEDTSLLVADARALGLDRGDPIVRRRLVAKMRYLLDDATPLRAPTADELQAHLAANQDRFQVPIRLALEQRFFDRGVRGAALDSDARAALAILTTGAEEPGDPHRIGASVPLQTRRQLADIFGGPFARSVVEAPVDVWSGPHASSRGLHLVRVTEHQPARPARLDELRRQVEASWRHGERKAGSRAQIDALRTRHGLAVRGAP